MPKRKRAARSRRTTLRDVARRAGVSIWTASSAFNHPERVAEGTRRRVLDAAGELGFTGPDPGARSLALGRSGMVALVAPGDADALLRDPAAALVTRGVLSACDREGLSLVLTARADGGPCDGTIALRAHPGGRVDGPLVLADAPPEPGAAVVAADVRGAGAALAGHLAELGHRDIAVLSHPGAGERLAGVLDAWSGARVVRVEGRGTAGAGGADGERARCVPLWPTRADGEAAARAALSADPRPTALLALSDTLAAGALVTARRVGLRVPEDLSLAGIDDLPGSEALGLTSALVPYRPLGEAAGHLLAALVAGEEGARGPEPLPCPLSPRGSTAPPPGGRQGGGGVQDCSSLQTPASGTT